jgi:hypothetical protein
MEMFLTLSALSILGVVVSFLLFAAATRNVRDEPQVETQVDPRLGMAPSHFFVDDRKPMSPPPVSIEALLLQIEGHVRLEQAAAEAFQNAPTVEALHMSTTSPLVH